MNHPATAPALPHLQAEGDVALRGVDVRAAFHDLLGEVTLTQTYLNREDRNIEAVYTFPLALDAVLLDLTVQIGERTLRGRVVEKKQAQELYEDAVTDGDTAVLLTQPEPGLYVMNVGNLMPGEEARITVRYAQLFRWLGDQLRIHLPTTLAPRYGTPGRFEPHETPEFTFDDALRFSLEIELLGGLRMAEVDCPSHMIACTRTDGGQQVSLAGGAAVMDRDFVLTVTADEAARRSARSAPDRDGAVALASFHPDFQVEDDPAPRLLKIVVDCSGSMSGDSIAQARAALSEILDHLRPQDRFNLVAFGSRSRALFDAPQPAAGRALEQARAFAAGLDASMGGTELGAALGHAYGDHAVEAAGADLLLITDGQVWDVDPILQQADRSGHRHFTVGVGSAVTETLLQELARRTGGACELVAPREDMAARVVRHFKRIYFPRADEVAVRWPVPPKRVLPDPPGPVFTGDTLHAFAWFDEPPEGEVVLELRLPDGARLEQRAALQHTSADDPASATLARLAARERLVRMEDAADAVPLAVAYQLVSPWTSCIVVDVRSEDEKADTLPELRKIAHTVPAGWHGMGTVYDIPISAAAPAPEAAPAMMKMRRSVILNDLFSSPRTQVDADPAAPQVPASPDIFERLDRWVAGPGGPPPEAWTIDELRRLGFPEDTLEALRLAVGLGLDEAEVVAAYLHHIARGDGGARLSRRARRVIRKAFRSSSLTETQRAQLEARFRSLTAS